MELQQEMLRRQMKATRSSGSAAGAVNEGSVARRQMADPLFFAHRRAWEIHAGAVTPQDGVGVRGRRRRRSPCVRRYANEMSMCHGVRRPTRRPTRLHLRGVLTVSRLFGLRGTSVYQGQIWICLFESDDLTSASAVKTSAKLLQRLLVLKTTASQSSDIPGF